MKELMDNGHTTNYRREAYAYVGYHCYPSSVCKIITTATQSVSGYTFPPTWIRLYKGRLLLLPYSTDVNSYRLCTQETSGYMMLYVAIIVSCSYNRETGVGHCHYNTPSQAMEMVDQGWNLNLVLRILLVILTRAEESSCYYQYSSYVQEETSSFIYLLNGMDTRTSLAPGRPTIHFKE